jgi:hypothetical protein
MGNRSVYYAYSVDRQRCASRRLDSSLMFSPNKPLEGNGVLVQRLQERKRAVYCY